MRYLITALFALGCQASPGSAQIATLSVPPATRDSVTRILDELASAISKRDADGAARYIRQDHHAVYVSDGRLIRGTEYRRILHDFYQGLRSLRLAWDSLEIEPAGRSTWVVTSWAAIRAVDTTGQETDSHAVFSFVIGHGSKGWEIVAAHKTTIPSPAQSRTRAASVVGTWRLATLVDTLPDGSVYRWLGPRPTGEIRYDSTGHMAVQFMADPRPTVAGGTASRATSEELRAVYNGYYAYFGRYQLSARGDSVAHFIRGSLHPEEVGVVYRRSVRLAGDRLFISVQFVDSTDHVLHRRFLTFNRVR